MERQLWLCILFDGNSHYLAWAVRGAHTSKEAVASAWPEPREHNAYVNVYALGTDDGRWGSLLARSDFLARSELTCAKRLTWQPAAPGEWRLEGGVHG